ncbi:hypothetical protein [Umezawaea sp.]|uniref:ATP-binding protein n=1 Tax=Umezawaea sp. TaxID=1955258 RepID=UPI002ED5E09A
MDARQPTFRHAGAPIPWELRIADHDTAGAVRRSLREHCRSSAFDGLLVDDVLLVASELVANTYAHSDRPRVLRLSSSLGDVLVEVGRAEPAPALRSSPLCPSRASTLLDRLCSGWGVLPDPDGGESAWALLPGQVVGGASASAVVG